MDNIIFSLIILLTVAFDSYTEKWIKSLKPHVTWSRYHILRFSCMFLLWGIVTVSYIDWYYWVGLAIVARILWRSIFRDRLMWKFWQFDWKF